MIDHTRLRWSNRRFSTFGLWGASLVGLASACGGTTAPDGAEPVVPADTATASEGSLEKGDPWDVSLEWKERGGGTLKQAGDALEATLTNSTDLEQSGRLVLEASGLDGRRVDRPMGTFAVPASDSITLAVPVNALPIQSEESPSAATLRVELDRADSTVLRVQTSRLHYVFTGDYSSVELYSTTELSSLPSQGLRTSNLMDVRGRIWDVATDTLQPVDGAESGSRQGLTIATRPADAPQRKRADRARPGTGVLGVAESALEFGTSIVAQVCTNWRVWYSDSGFGEDYWTTNGWMDVRAAYAYVVVEDASTRYWEGNLDSIGCTPPITVPSSSVLNVTQYTDWMKDPATGSRFDNYYDFSGGACTDIGFQSITTAFATPDVSGEGVEVMPTWNDEAVQTAAITGQILLANHQRVSTGLDPLIRDNMSVMVYSNCGPYDAHGVRLQDYAAGGMQAVHLGPRSGGNGEPGAWHKFLVAHEIGHTVQYAALGAALYSNYSAGDDTRPVCRCDHVLSMPEHCIQSREDLGTAQNEGFGHYFATRVWNNDGQNDPKFVYYKRFQQSNTVGDYRNPPVALNAFDSYRWMNRKCSAPYDHRGSEWDWLAFYTHVTSRYWGSSRTTLPNLYGIYARIIGGAMGYDPSYSTILASALAYYGGSTTEPRYDRFRTTSISQGVNH